MPLHRRLKREVMDLLTNIISYGVIGLGYSFWRQRPWPITAVAKGKTILDLGSGPCVNGVAVALRNSGYVVCLDISKTMAYAAKASINRSNVFGDAIVADALKPPFRSNSFDTILIIAVAHHVPRTILPILFSEARRVLKVMGLCIATVWSWRHRRFALRTFFNAISTFFGVLGYIRRYVVPWRSRGRQFERVYYLYDLRELVKAVNSVNMVVASSGYTWYLRQDNLNAYVAALKGAH